MVELKFYNDVMNIGDQLAPVVNAWMLRGGADRSEKEINLMTIGSILAADFFDGDSVVWGTGIHYVEDAGRLAYRKSNRNLDIRAVRGPITRRVLSNAGYMCPRLYGDPAILMPFIYQPQKIIKKSDLTIIRQYKDRKISVEKEYKKINVATSNYKQVIDEIVSSKLVISASLHGIILAESYGIPAVWLAEECSDELLKYYDWYYSTGRYTVKAVNSIDEALRIRPMDIPDLSLMQRRLMKAYPYDIYDSTYSKPVYRFALWGAGDAFEKNIDEIRKYIDIDILVDEDKKKWGNTFYGLECKSPETLAKEENLYIIMMLMREDLIDEISHKIENMGIFYYDKVSDFLRQERYRRNNQ